MFPDNDRKLWQWLAFPKILQIKNQGKFRNTIVIAKSNYKTVTLKLTTIYYVF